VDDPNQQGSQLQLSPACAVAYARLAAQRDGPARVEAAAALVLAVFDEFYQRVSEMPYAAQRAFERQDLHASVGLSSERLQLYSRYILEHGPRIGAAFPELADSAATWDALDACYAALIAERYEADIAFSFAHSLRRNIGHERWRPVAYSFPPPSVRRELSMASVYRRTPLDGPPDARLIAEALQAPGFAVPFRDLAGDAQRVLARVQARLADAGVAPAALDVVQAGFFRDRTAVVVARWLLPGGGFLPLVIALRNGPEGIHADAVLDHTEEIHDLFSSALANFHVTTRLYYQTCRFLYRLMPRRPLGHHYSTIGFNHVGKVAILDELLEQMRQGGQRFQRSPGTPGTVAIGFTFEDCDYHLKIIRDRPTRAYKWGAYPGLAAVVDKYRVVHEINRANSMLDNVMYFNLRLERSLFEPGLLEEIVTQATGSAQMDGDGLLLRSLIVQLKIVPLPVYLESAGEDQTRQVIASLGRCIRNNAATNVFNKDLDSRNYGVGRYGRVFLFDYDAVERLTEVKIRSNRGREPGEEAPPDWFFEAGPVFLPEELEVGMQFRSRHARRCFREENAELLEPEYWLDMQRKLASGELPELVAYPPESRLR
jgi:isocitrate dehydrogenase kinase/phosphatase